MNPKMIRPIVQALVALAKMGVQIFITTHDYFVQQEFNMLTVYPELNPDHLDICFMSLFRDEDTGNVRFELEKMASDLKHNAIMQEFDASMIESRGLSMVIKEESGLKFGFPDGDSVVKFDDTKFYRNSFNALPESKGVDFISTGQDAISFIEVKNCLGDEGNNRWRIAPDNQKHDTTATNNDVTGRDSFDIEVSQKVAMTLAALSGARSFGRQKRFF